MTGGMEEEVGKLRGEVAALRNTHEQMAAMLARWIRWRRSESVDCALEFDTARLLRSVNGQERIS